MTSPIPEGGEERVREFYGALLGLREKEAPASLPGVIWFEAGDGERELHFVVSDEDVDPSTQRHFCLEVDDVDELRARLDGAGYATRDATPIPNRPRFVSRDPFGNVVEFTAIRGPYA